MFQEFWKVILDNKYLNDFTLYLLFYPSNLIPNLVSEYLIDLWGHMQKSNLFFF